MTPEDAIQVADELLTANTGNPLTDIQRMILQESLGGKNYEEMQGYAFQHIKNEGKKLWGLLSKALGEKVSKKSFKGALQKRLKSGGMVPKPPQPSNYDEQTWAGREKTVSTLLPKLQEQTRILWLTGISGIGKTALGECLASQAWKNDPSFQWIYHEVLEGQSQDFASVVADLLAKLGERDIDPQERNNPNAIAKLLIQKLQSRTYWLQLDALERLLAPGQSTDFIDPYWVTFLQRCLTESDWRSRLVLTAQALPATLIEFEDRYPNTWTEVRLDGLLQAEQQIEFFAKRGIEIADSNQNFLIRIAEIYEGHPLVLKVIAEDILKDWAGNISGYWQAYQPEFEQVARELQATRRDETEYNEGLDRKVRERIKRSLQQLPKDALDLLCRSAVFRRPVPKKFWLQTISNHNSQQQKAAYGVLSDRALIEKEGCEIRQHNLIRAVAYDLLRADLEIWEASERKAADLWLTEYKPAPDAPNLETVRGYLEAIDHYCEVEDWVKASELFMNPQNMPANVRLQQQLDIWSYFREEINLCVKFVGKSTPDIDLICFGGIGHGNLGLCFYPRAIKAYESLLILSQMIGDRAVEGSALGNLGNAYNALGMYNLALNFYQRHRDITRELGARAGEAKAYGNTGVALANLGRYKEAIDSHKQHLALAREIGDRASEGTALGNLGTAYNGSGQHKKALPLHCQHLKIAREIGDRASIATALGNLGNSYSGLKKYERAVHCHQKQLIITREIGDLWGNASALANLGSTQTHLKQFSEALENLEAARKIFERLCVSPGVAKITAMIGQAHFRKGDYSQALKHCQTALKLSGEVKDYALEGECYKILGETHLKLNEFPQARYCLQKSLDIAREVGAQADEAEVLKTFSELHLALEEIELARQYCQEALTLATKLEIPLAAECEELQLKLELL